MRVRSRPVVWIASAVVAAVTGLYVALAVSSARGADEDDTVAEQDTADPTGDAHPSELSLRRALVFVNALANLSMLTALGLPLAGLAVAGVGLAVAHEETARHPGFKRLLGWTSWLMPMSWPVIGAGCVVLAGDLAGHFALGDRVDAARVRRVSVDPATGTVLTEGGLLFRPGFRGGFNMGGLSFITPGADSVVPHETGHALSLAAFGWVYHLIGGLDRALRKDHGSAYAERVAESNRSPSRRDDWVSVWGVPELFASAEEASGIRREESPQEVTQADIG